MEIDASLTCDEVSLLFHRDPDLGCLLVREGDRIGIISRTPFALAMAGRLGYGRALHGHQLATALTNWDPLTLPADTSVEEAAALVVARRQGEFHPDVVLQASDGSFLTITAPFLFQALAGQFAYRASHDHLTGLPNRETFARHLERQCATASPGALAVFFIDLDNFKHVNDNFGHGVGDLLLRHVAAQLRAATRPGDLIARLAGDEFATVVRLTPSAGVDQTMGHRPAAAIGERLLQAINATVVPDHPVTARVSIGVAICGEVADPETLQREADLAMYAAKQAGGNQIHVVDDVTNRLQPHPLRQAAPESPVASTNGVGCTTG